MTESDAFSADVLSIARELFVGKGSLPFEFVLARFLPVTGLRDLVRRHGLNVKGYRPDRAPAAKLASVVAKGEESVLEDACRRVLDEWRRRAGAAPRTNKVEGDTVLVAVHHVVEQSLAAARSKLERLEEQSARHREQVDELRRQLQSEREEGARLRATERQRRSEVEAAERRAKASADASALGRRVHELERDLETLGESEAGLRRLLAARETRLREAEAHVVELEELVPKSRRRRRWPALEPDAHRRFFQPRFAASFYRSLDGKERSAVERAFRAVFSLCTEGPGYPGLEVKQIEGQDLWSCRASLKLRVYFRLHDDEVEVLELSDREDQHTALRRLKER